MADNSFSQSEVSSSKSKQRKELYQLVGKLPDRKRPITVELISTQETAGGFIQPFPLRSV